jgi:hypothetical protein
MHTKLGLGSVVVLLGIVAFLALGKAPIAEAQRAKADHAWDYKVSVISYNPGERLTDEQRAAQFEKLLNAEAKQGWEPVTSLLTRNNVQTIGGGVTTRDSTSFIAFRRARGRVALRAHSFSEPAESGSGGAGFCDAISV